MRKKESFIGIFLIFFLISFIFLNSSKSSFLIKAASSLEHLTKPIQAGVQGIFTVVKPKETQLKNENQDLIKKIINQEELIKENKALKDQFEVSLPFSPKILPAKVIGAPGFLPGISRPESFVLDQGEKSGIKLGQTVIFKDNLVGKITKVSGSLSSVELLTNNKSLFSAKTLETNALGVVKGQGNTEMILDNVLLSDNLKEGDIVMTKGDLNEEGVGFPQGIIAGKVGSIEKKPSALFQSAKIESLLDFSKIDKVFIITGY